MAKEEETIKEEAALKAGKHYHAAFRELLSYVKTAAEWWPRGDIPWKTELPKSKAKKTMFKKKGKLQKEQNHQETLQN